MDVDLPRNERRPEDRIALALLALALVVAAVLLLEFASGLTFFQDTWEFLMNRRALTATAFLEPHNEHIVVIPVALEQLMLRVFGMSSATPEYVLLTPILLATATVVFLYARRRVGSWLALMAAIVLLFLGPAWEDLLWPFEIGLVGSLLFGVATLMALERRDRRSDLAACALLVVSVGFSSLGLAFIVGAAVDVFQQRRERGLRRAYLFAVPLLLYAAWYAGWGHHAEKHMSLHNLAHSPGFVLHSITASLDSLLALSTIANETVGRSRWGLPVLIVLLLALAYRQWRRPGVSPRLWPVLFSAATFWLLAAFNYVPGREAWVSRYLYVGGAFVILIAANLLDGVRPGRRTLLVGGAVAVAVAVLNLGPLREGRNFLRAQSALTRADLSAIEIARRTVDPSFALSPEVTGAPYLVNVQAGEYLQAVDEYGSPAYTPAELAKAPQDARRSADVVLAFALPLSIEVEAHARQGSRRGACVRAPGGGSAPLPLRPGLTTVELAPGGPGTIRMRRFASAGYPLEKQGVPGGSTATIRLPRDGASRRWTLQVEADQGAAICR